MRNLSRASLGDHVDGHSLRSCAGGRLRVSPSNHPAAQAAHSGELRRARAAQSELAVDSRETRFGSGWLRLRRLLSAMAAAVARPSSGSRRPRPAQHAPVRVRPFSAPARRIGQQQQQHPAPQREQRPQAQSPGSPGSGGSSLRRPGSAASRGGSAYRRNAQPGPSPRDRPRPSSARTVLGAATSDQYGAGTERQAAWAGEARTALDRRAATPVGRSYYFSNDHSGRWRGLGRAQWAWHNAHGHTALAVLQEQRPWDPRPVTRATPIMKSGRAQGVAGIGGAFTQTVFGSLGQDIMEEEGDQWKNATPTRMMGTSGVQQRGWSNTGGVCAAKARRGKGAGITAQQVMNDLDRFESRLRANAYPRKADAPDCFPGLKMDGEASFVDSSDEEDEESAPVEGPPKVASSRPPTASRRPVAGGLRRSIDYLHRLHGAAVQIQRVARGMSGRRRVAAILS